jgi:3-oxoacyl-[acyl-carrier-protein] synthase-1
MAKERGANILGEIAAYSFSSDGHHLSVSSLDGLSNAMSKALDLAKMEPIDIAYICAHATSTPAGDAAEAENIYAVFGEECPWVSSTKSMTGHELWMSGASQVVYSVIMAQDGFIARNINFKEQESECKQLNIVTETIDRPPETVLCNSAGFGGTNSCIILRFNE